MATGQTDKNTTIESYNSHLAHSVKNSFFPSWLEIFIYFLASTILLSLLNYNVFTNSIGVNSGVSQAALNSYLHDKFASSTDFLSRILEGRAGSLLFWAFLGSIIYMMVWVIQNLVINIENDVQASEFVGLKGQEAKKKAYWHSVLSYKIFFVCGVIAFIVYVIALATFFLPLTSKVFGLAITSPWSLKSIVDIVLAIFATVLLLYIFVLGLRFIVRVWQWIIGNF